MGQQALRTCRVSVRSPCGTATGGVTSRLAPVLTRRLAWPVGGCVCICVCVCQLEKSECECAKPCKKRRAEPYWDQAGTLKPQW